MAENLSTAALPPGQPIDVVLAQPFFVDPATTAVRADELRKTWHVIAVEARSGFGQRA